MNWRGAGKNKDYSNYAMVQIVSSLLTVLIVSGSVSTIVVFSVSTIEDKNEENETSSIEKYFNKFSDAISESVNDRIGDKNSIRISGLKGEILMDNNYYDRTIVTYTNDSAYDFSISGLDGKVKEFEISLDNSDTTYTIYNIDNEGNLEDPPQCAGIVIVNNKIYSEHFFEDKILIELYSPSYNGGNDPFGKIWLFDSNSLNYSSSRDNYNLVLEKAGLLFEEAGNVQIKNSQLITIYDSNIALHICQTLTKDIISVGSSTNTQNIYLTNKGSAVQEAKYVFNLRFQFYNGHAQDWFNYYNDIIDVDDTLFDEDPVGSLLYLPSSITQDGIWFTLMHSIVDFELI